MHRKTIHFQLLFFLLALPLFAQGLINVEAKVDRSRIRIGDRITYSLIIDRADSLQIKTPGHGANLGMFEIKDYRVHSPEQSDGRLIEQFDYTISVFDTGHFEIPPFPIGFLLSDTATQYQFITSEGIDIYVESIVNDPNADIRDLKPLFDIPDNWAVLIAILLGVLVLAAVGYWIYRKYFSGEKIRPAFRKEVIRPAHEIALEALQKLQNKGLLAKGAYKAHYTELSDILRHYIEGRFFISAMEETTAELVQSLNQEGIDSESITFIQGALSNCDLVKFARYLPSDSESEVTLDLVRRIIDRTKLAFEAVEKSVPVEEKNQTTIQSS